MTLSTRRVAPGDVDHELVWSAVALVSGVAFVAWARMPDAPALPCVFHLVTGLPCVTCGSTRALLALLAGHLWDALRWNPLACTGAFGAAIYVIYAATAVIARLPRITVHLGARDWRALRIATVAALACNWTFLLLDGR